MYPLPSLVFVVLGIEPSPSYMLSMCSMTERYPQPSLQHFVTVPWEAMHRLGSFCCFLERQECV